MSCLQVKIAICYVIRIIPASYFQRYVLKAYLQAQLVQLFFFSFFFKIYIIIISFSVTCDVIYAIQQFVHSFIEFVAHTTSKLITFKYFDNLK